MEEKTGAGQNKKPMIKINKSSLVAGLRRLTLSTLVVLSLALAFMTTVNKPAVATAATNSTINFQARLMTGAGAVVPDNSYNVEFKLYNALTSSGSSQGSCTGDSACLWTETRTGGNKVTVQNGYLTVNLGSVTAFPTTINWDQDLYISLNIGGTGTPTWDGEMTPRLHLTAVPYALRAGQLAQYNGTTGYTSTLNIVQPTGGNQIFNIPDQGAAGTYNLLTTNAASGSFVQLQASTPGTAQTGNLNISGVGIVGTSVLTPLLDTPSGTTTLNIGTNNATAGINLNQNVTVASGKSVTIQGAVTQSNGAVSMTTTTTSISSTTSTSVTSSGSITLTAGGASTWSTSSGNLTIQAATTNTLKLQTAGAGTLSLGDQNTTTITMGTGSNIARTITLGTGTGGSAAQAVTLGSIGGSSTTLIQGGTSGTAIGLTTGANGNIVLDTSAGTGGITLKTNGGAAIVAQSATNTTTAFQVQGNGGATSFNVDTTNKRVTAGTNNFGTASSTATGQLYVSGSAPTSATTLSMTDSPTYSVAAAGRYVYVRTFGFLRVVDVSNPASPVIVGSVALSSGVSRITTIGHYVYSVTSGNNAFQVIDVSRPNSPTLVITKTVTSAYTVAAQGRYVVLGTQAASNNIQIWDVANPSNPVLAGQMTANGTNVPYAVTISGKYAYFAEYLKLQIVDISNPASPTSIGTLTTTAAQAVTVQGKYAYLINNNGSSYNMQVVDVSNPASPTSVGTTTATTDAQNIAVQDRVAYITSGTGNSVQAIEIANPASPTVLGTTNVSSALREISIQGRYAYVADYGNSYLRIFDLGGTYTQQLEAGGIQGSTLSVDNNSNLMGDVSIGGGLQVGQSVQVSGNFGASGNALFANTTNSVTAFQVQNAASTTIFDVDTTNGQVGIGNAAPAYVLDVTGDINTSTKLRVGGAIVCTTTGCVPASGSTYYIQNGTTAQSANMYVQAATSGSVAAVIQANAAGTGDILDLKAGDGTLIMSASSTGTVLLQNATNSLNGFVVNSAASGTNQNILRVDTISERVAIGVIAGTPSAKLNIATGSTVGLRVYQSGAFDAFELANATADILDISQTGATIHKTTTNSTTAFQIQNTSSANVFDVDTTNSRVGIGGIVAPAVSLDVEGAVQQTGLTTSNTQGTDNNKWTLLGTCTIAAQFRQCVSSINILGGHDGNTGDNTQATVSMRVKQQNALAGAPYVNLTLNNTAEVITKNDIVAVTTQNDATATVVQVYGRITNTFEQWYYTPVLNSDQSPSKWAWSQSAGFLAALPAGTQTAAVYGDSVANTMLVQSANNSTTAFQVQNSTANPVLDVDTTNTRVGIGTAAPSRTLDVAVNNTATNALPLLVEQAGSGDVGMELKMATQSYYFGADATDGSLKISSNAATGTTTVLGYNTIGTSVDSSDQNFINATKFTASATGTISQLYSYINTVDNSPNNKAQMAIYADNAGSPGTLLSSSGDVALSASAWNTFSINPVTITSGTVYWIGYNTNSSSGSKNNFKILSAGGTNQTKYVAQTYGTWPGTWSGGTFTNSQASFYALISSTSPANTFSASLMSLSSTGATTFQNSVDSTGAFKIQNAGGTSNLFVADTMNTRIAIGQATAGFTLDVAGDINATSALRVAGTSVCDTTGTTGCIAKSGSGYYIHNQTTQQTANLNIISASTSSVTALFQAASGQTADVLQIKDGSGNNLLEITNGSVILGYGGNTLTMSASSTRPFEPTLAGSARHAKSIILTPEYAGAALDASNDASCSGNSNGTMISGFDLTNLTNYYKWTTSQASNQCYDVVVRVPVPSDWAAWNGAPTVATYSSDLTNGLLNLEVRDSNGTVETNDNYVSVTPTATTTWQTKTGGTLGGTYTAGGVMTLRIRMKSPQSGDVRIGNITLNYFSNY